MVIVTIPAKKDEARLNHPTTIPVVPTKNKTLSTQWLNSIRRNGKSSSAHRAQRMSPQSSRRSPTARVEPWNSVTRAMRDIIENASLFFGVRITVSPSHRG